MYISLIVAVLNMALFIRPTFTLLSVYKMFMTVKKMNILYTRGQLTLTIEQGESEMGNKNLIQWSNAENILACNNNICEHREDGKRNGKN